MEMEDLLCTKARAADCIQAWGELYARDQPGVHQIHSMRRSCAVEEDILKRDGALMFFHEKDHTSELLLLKFCGQP
jgi:hypothetical protein